MSAIDQAFIRAYELDEAEPAPPHRAAAKSPVRIATIQQSKVVESIAGQPVEAAVSQSQAKPVAAAVRPMAPPPIAPPKVVEPQGTSQRRPLSTFAQPSQTVEARFKPALEVDSFRWSTVSQQLVDRCRRQLQPAVETLLAADDAGRSLLGVGAQSAGAGCTTLVACLARLLVEAGKTVAIVDANFARPGLATHLGLAAEIGWEDVLSGRVSLAEAVVHSLGDRVSLLPLAIGGAAAASRLETIHASVTAGVLRYHYDIVLFDLGVVADTQQGPIARRVIQQCRLDGALVASGRGAAAVQPQQLLRSAPELATICLGVVENQLRAAEHPPRADMYLDYWQLDAKPFEPGCDARSFYRGAAFQSAINKLRYAIENGRAAGVVAGPAGVGKTLLVETLRQQLGEQYQPFVRVVFPQMTDRDLLVYLAEQFGAPPADPPRYTIEESLRRLEYILADNVSRKRHAVVVVDEAHLLEDSGLLEPLRLLLNLGAIGAPPFTLLLVGQPTLGPIVQRHGGFDERVDIKVLLPALSATETADYIAHRLEAAGATREIFAADALKTAHQLTGGIPRRINRLCDLALLVGFANGQHTIDAESLHAIHGELVTVPAAA